MRESYDEAFAIELPGGPEPLCRLLRQQGETAVLAVRTLWTESVRTIEVPVLVPGVRPAPFDWDRGLHGHVVQTTAGPRGEGAARFCHPRLRSDLADQVARAGLAELRDQVDQVPDWGFRWESWYDRVNEAVRLALAGVMEGRQQPRQSLLRSRFQRAVQTLLNGGAEGSGLPVTDESLILLHMYQVESGHPDVPNDTLLYEKLKAKFLGYLDGHADILFTGKSDVGRHVMRIKEGSPKNHQTGRPMPLAAVAISALAAHGNPIRFYREGKALPQGLVFEQPVEPPLRVRGYRMPKPWRDRTTVLTVAIADAPGQNVHVADDQVAMEFGVAVGDVLCLDRILVTPTGREKLRAFQPFQELLSAERFLPRLAQLQERPGFHMREIPELVEILESGEQVRKISYRYGYNKPLPVGVDKVKFLPGGVKAVTWPVSQLFARIPYPEARGGEQLVPVDAVIAAQTAISKGARDLILYAAATMAGLSEIDPDWSLHELLMAIQAGFVGRGLHVDGRFALVSQVERVEASGEPIPDADTIATLMSLGHRCPEAWFDPDFGKQLAEPEYRKLGVGMVGHLPAMRAPETEERQSNAHTGVSVNMQIRGMSGIPLDEHPYHRARTAELAEFYMANGERAAALNGHAVGLGEE